MNHEEYHKMIKSYGEQIKMCDWCNNWKPVSKFRNNKFIGYNICNKCYWNIHRATRTREDLQKLLDWVTRRMSKILLPQENSS